MPSKPVPLDILPGEREAREECARRGIDPDELCADGGVEAWMVVAKELEEEHKRGKQKEGP